MRVKKEEKTRKRLNKHVFISLRTFSSLGQEAQMLTTSCWILKNGKFAERPTKIELTIGESESELQPQIKRTSHFSMKPSDFDEETQGPFQDTVTTLCSEDLCQKLKKWPLLKKKLKILR